MSHPIHRRLLAEQLLGLRRSTEGRRYASAQRSGRIDANPHQVDAVIFALGRVREGGCILADEVGLGKTIEAGLVMAQLRAEGAQRILLVSPKALLGQWRDELFTLFGISVVEPGSAEGDGELSGPGVFLVGRDLLGSERGLERLVGSGPFDLCVVDEAHEVFAGIYRRFDRSGHYLDDSPHARLAGRLKSLLGGHTPVLLLTATPLQNSLAELWGLVQYVDRSGTLLGDLPTFRQLFCSDDDRMLASGQEDDLQRRMQVVIRRTLRRQAQEFMKTPFVGRRARLFEYDMTAEERELYDDVTRYLLTPGLAAFRGRQRRLLVIGFHRRMASSHRALRASLERVAERLRRMLAGDDAEAALDFYDDLEESDEVGPTDSEEGPAPEDERIRAELSLVESFVARLGGLATDSKALALLDAVRVVSEAAARGEGSGKLVIFTESLATQDYVRELLLGSGLVGDEQITLFRGQNTSPRAAQALARWDDEVGQTLGKRGRPTRDVAMRLALVHEFRQSSRVLIATEAGAKGLNLQFCDTVINYDLPWNPQRIEQRIGRCHRYGQARDVTVINFLARDNAAQRLTFEILSRKLELFGAVLDASDQVLHEPERRTSGRALAALSADFATELRRIYQSARSVEQIEQELSRLSDSLDASRTQVEAMHERTAGIIASRFDEAVRQAFRQIAEELPIHLRELDQDLERLVCDYLESEDVRYRRVVMDGATGIDIAPNERLPEPFRAGGYVVVGSGAGPGGSDPLNANHPLVQRAAEAAREVTRDPFRIRIGRGDRSAEIETLRGRRGRLRVMKLRYPGFEPVDRLVPVVVLEDGAGSLDAQTTLRLLGGSLEAVPELETRVSDEELEEAVEEALFLDEREVSRLEHGLFERAIVQLDRFIEDRVLILKRSRAELVRRIQGSRRDRDAAAGSEARGRIEALLVHSERELEGLEAELARLQARDDEGYRRWRQHAYERRYAPPEREPILSAEFVIG
ncbi:MAG TPA: SNF2-related protein [Polyangiaceae bacterium]|nr:SNF2-related protein [Polyangiaceae bacterium]